MRDKRNIYVNMFLLFFAGMLFVLAGFNGYLGNTFNAVVCLLFGGLIMVAVECGRAV